MRGGEPRGSGGISGSRGAGGLTQPPDQRGGGGRDLSDGSAGAGDGRNVI